MQHIIFSTIILFFKNILFYLFKDAHFSGVVASIFDPSMEGGISCKVMLLIPAISRHKWSLFLIRPDKVCRGVRGPALALKGRPPRDRRKCAEPRGVPFSLNEMPREMPSVGPHHIHIPHQGVHSDTSHKSLGSALTARR